VRDIIADNAPALPDDYAYGSGTTDPTESNTALSAQETTQDLDRVLLDKFDTQASWDNTVPTFADDVPLKVANGELQQARVTQFSEAENSEDVVGSVVGNSASTYGILSNDAGVELEGAGDFVGHIFTPDYTIPANEYVVDYYYSTDGFSGTVETRVNGRTVRTETFSNSSESNAFEASPFVGIELLENQHKIDVVCTEHNGGDFIVDTLQLIDQGDRFGSAWLTRIGTFDSNSATYDAPELYPDVQEVRLDTLNTTREITEGEIQSTWTDTSNKQFIELSNDGGSTWIRTNNNDTATASFSSPETNLDVNLGIARFAANTQTTPSNGDSSQKLDILSAFANPAALASDGIGETLLRAIIPPGTVTGTTISEAGIVGGNGDLLTRHTFAGQEVEQGQRLISAETTIFSSK